MLPISFLSERRRHFILAKAPNPIRARGRRSLNLTKNEKSLGKSNWLEIYICSYAFSAAGRSFTGVRVEASARGRGAVPLSPTNPVFPWPPSC